MTRVLDTWGEWKTRTAKREACGVQQRGNLRILGEVGRIVTELGHPGGRGSQASEQTPRGKPTLANRDSAPDASAFFITTSIRRRKVTQGIPTAFRVAAASMPALKIVGAYLIGDCLLFLLVCLSASETTNIVMGA